MSTAKNKVGGAFLSARRTALVGVSAAAVVALAATPAAAAPSSSIPESSTELQGSVEGSLANPLGSLGDLLPGSGNPENEGLYEGSVEVVGGEADDTSVLKGQVFDDANKNSVLDEGEAGVAGVQVSNGTDVATTDEEGRYELPAGENFTAFVTQPAGWQVPVDEQNFAQFSYNHLPEGSPDLKFGGLEPTGPTPKAVNFPMAKSAGTANADQTCPIASDTQTYDKEEVEFARKGAVADLMKRNDYATCGLLLLGDNVGDDLSLNPDLRGLYENANGPIRALAGNHDQDYDADSDEHALDTYRRDFGAPYYSYDVGDTHFVALDNIVYKGGKPDGKSGGYTEAIPEQQLEWLRNDLAKVDKDKQILVAAHAPIVNYSGVVTQNAAAFYDIIADYPNAATVGGHTHTLENLLAGDKRKEWADKGVPELTHDQIVAGAVSGSWYSGGLNDDGVPYAYTSDAAEPGVLTFQYSGDKRSEFYTVRNEPQERQMLVGLNTPTWREWAVGAKKWQDDKKQGDAPADISTTTVSAADLAGGESYLGTSFYAGSTEAKVEVSLDGGAVTAPELTQPATGEELRKGWEYTDTVSATHNLSTDGSLAQA
ncbi:calcineurin-like phosphoesterase C-terminal domain-containing protein, partial [Dietzia sp.]|uniref:calcineurin-like phosphoesterase C-terminal domain-containing protein n=1 Tax=Dietzia sp. TaxID=1871616 RepID=UPI002FD8B89C